MLTALFALLFSPLVLTGLAVIILMTVMLHLQHRAIEIDAAKRRHPSHPDRRYAAGEPYVPTQRRG